MLFRTITMIISANTKASPGSQFNVRGMIFKFGFFAR